MPGRLRVLDLTHHIAGPFCTKLLADYGADVVKVERPGTGDPARSMPPFAQDRPGVERSGLFMWLNGGKRSVTIDLKSAAGRAAVLALAADSDVVVSSFAPATLGRLGLDWPDLSAANPDLVLTTLSNFGWTGPYRDWKATEITFLAMGGLMYTTGEYGREPLKHGLTHAQVLAGAQAAVGTLAALNPEPPRRVGQHIDVSIHECVVGGIMMKTLNYAFLGAISRREPKSAGSGLAEAADGYVTPVGVGIGAETKVEKLAEVFAMPELRGEAYATPAGARANAAAANAEIRKRLRERAKLHWLHALQPDVIMGVVQDAKDLLESPQLLARGFWVDVEQPEAGKVRMPRPAVPVETGTPAGRPAPRLGEHNREVLVGRLGLGEAQLAAMGASAAVRAGR